MQGKAIIKFFTITALLVVAYQFILWFPTNSTEKDAERFASEMVANVEDINLKQERKDSFRNAYLDSVSTETVFEIAGGVEKVDINKFVPANLTNLQGFSTKPKIQVINNNPIVNSVQKNPDGFEDRLLDLLAAGGTRDFATALEPFGLDPTSPSFWEEALEAHLGALIEEAEAVASELGYA